MSTGQIHLFAYAEADDAAQASLLYVVALDIHPAFNHHRPVHHGVVQSGRDLCRT